MINIDSFLRDMSFIPRRIDLGVVAYQAVSIAAASRRKTLNLQSPYKTPLRTSSKRVIRGLILIPGSADRPRVHVSYSPTQVGPLRQSKLCTNTKLDCVGIIRSTGSESAGRIRILAKDEVNQPPAGINRKVLRTTGCLDGVKSHQVA